ncbi:hypothetical protein C1879_02400 [Paraeggerthella hongkongensis]|nr:hypothetical protein C1879_02400 [Paraeggerthella hongkongensis]
MNVRSSFAVKSSRAFVAVVALAFSAALSVGGSPAHAAVSSVSTAAVHASYANPDTGVIEDSGGQASEALGTSMSQGITGSSALVEKDADGSEFVTIRLSQADQIGEVSIASDVDRTGVYSEDVAAEIMQRDAELNTADYRAQVASAQATLRISMYVHPMGRSVVYFVQLSDAAPGNSEGFVESIVAGQGSEQGQAPDGGTARGSSEALEGSAASTAASGDSAGSGVREFDGEGREVTGSAAPIFASPQTYAIAAVAATAAVAAVAATYYLAYGRKRKARSDNAAAAAAGHGGSAPPEA